jgi:hypothetical protein
MSLHRLGLKATTLDVMDALQRRMPMGKRYGITTGMMCLGLAVGCQRSREAGESGTAAVKPATTSAATEGQSSVPGTIMVAGNGADLYYVFDETGKQKVGFTKTGAPLTLPPGTYTVSLNNVGKKVKVEAKGKTVIACGTLLVAGVGTSLYEVYDETGQHKLNFTYTNGKTELLEGSYVLKLTNSRKKVAVRAGEKMVVQAGRLTVEGDGKELYEVYDQAGKVKLDFTSTGKVMELFPGTYTVVYRQKKFPAVVKGKEQTTVKPK